MKKIILFKFIILLTLFSSTSLSKGTNAEMIELRNKKIDILNKATAMTDEEDEKIREEGIFPSCQKGQEYELGLCYEPCKQGTIGVGPYCWKNCPKGFNDIGITCIKKPETTKKVNYNRGKGSFPICASNKQKKMGVCFDKCKSGYKVKGTKCQKGCPSGYRDFGFACYKRWWSWQRKKSYTLTGRSFPKSCPSGKKFSKGLCYTPCKKGHTGLGPICGQNCPPGFRDAGFTCVHSGEIFVKEKEKRVTEPPVLSGLKKPKNIRYIRDEKGRALILHGINSSNSAKKSDDNMSWVKEKDVIQETKEFGMNAVRLLIFWSAIEPEKGVYNEKYLEEVAKRVKWYTDNGAWVVLDMHQDLYSKSVGGNGAPDWATITEPYDEYKDKKVTDLHEDLKGLWWLQNINPATMQAFKNFWNYDNGKYKYLQDHYVKAWIKVVKRFKDNPRVLGYDLMNEPHNADLSSAFEKRDLHGLYKRLIEGIREHDNDKWIFFEPRSFGVNFGVASDLKKVVDVRSGPSRLVYAPHMYPPLIHDNVPYGGVDRKTVSNWSLRRAEELDLHEAPLWVGEIGSNEQVGGFFTYLEEILNVIDYMGGSWMWWSNDRNKSWGLVNWKNEPNEKVKYLVRTYPRAVSGDPIAHFFDVHTAKFTLKFKTRAGLNEKTEIFVPKMHYPDGFDIKVFNETSGTRWSHTYDESSQILYLETGNIGTPYTVLITRKK